MSDEARGPRGYNSRDPEIAELRETIERLTKDLEEARLQDSNQWRREYWKHYNDLKARADSLAAELAKARDALKRLTGTLTVEIVKADNCVVRNAIRRVKLADIINAIEEANFDALDALEATPEPQSWTKKRKNTAVVHTHPTVDRAIVQNMYGIQWDGKSYKTLDEAKQAALPTTPRKED